MLRSFNHIKRLTTGMMALTLVASAMFVVSSQQPAMAWSDSIYPGGAANVPDWVVEGKSGPDKYMELQAELDARTVRTQFIESRPDAWRYVVYAGHWWYYQPNKQWLVYDNNGWKPYVAPVVTQDQPTVASSVTRR